MTNTAITPLYFKAGRFSVALSTDVPHLKHQLEHFYPFQKNSSYSDFHVSLLRANGIRRYIKPQSAFAFSGLKPFDPFPVSHSFPLLEWGLNWCVTRHYQQCVVMHAAVVEKAGRAIVLPGEPGAGKSTLSAALAGAGWNLFSDELTLIEFHKAKILPNPRPISLKNQSIDIISERFPQWHFSPPVLDTVKGTVSLFSPGSHQYDVRTFKSDPGLLVFPKLSLGGVENLKSISKAEALRRFIEQSFNYSVIGEDAFLTLATFVEQSSCYEYQYDGNLDKAISTLSDLL